jgi:hypothetical protein
LDGSDILICLGGSLTYARSVNNTKLLAFMFRQSVKLAVSASSAVHHIFCILRSYKEAEAENVPTMNIRFRPQRPSATCPDQS